MSISFKLKKRKIYMTCDIFTVELHRYSDELIRIRT